MNALRLLAAGMMVCVLTASAQADDKKDKPDHAKLLIGKWEMTKAADDLPVGSVIEFTKDGKMKIVAKKDGKEETINAIYKVEGAKIEYTLKLGDKDEKKKPLTIKKISEQELLLVFQAEKQPLEFKRVK